MTGGKMNRFSDNARVCFVGDSITAQNRFVSFIAAYYKENYQDSNINFYVCGASGGTAATQYDYFDDDVLSHSPTHIFVMLGVNDSCRDFLGMPRGEERYRKLYEAYETYRRNLARLCEKIARYHVEFILCTPPPYAEYQKTEKEPLAGGYALIAEYAEYVRTLAKENDYYLLDCHKYLSRMSQNEDLYDADHIHPNDRGHYHLAKFILQQQGLNIGKMKEVPKVFQKWRDKTQELRDIYAVETMVVRNYSLSLEEKMQIVRHYVDNQLWNELQDHVEFFKRITKNYLVNKPRQDELFKEINEIMEVELKKQS